MPACFCTGLCMAICYNCGTKQGCGEVRCACYTIKQKVAWLWKNVIDKPKERPDDDIRWYSIDFSIEYQRICSRR